jgi:hypothetical protein
MYSLHNAGQPSPLPDDLILLIERVTHIGAIELCLPPEKISLRETLFQTPDHSNQALVAEVLEHQIHMLRSQLKKGDVSEHVKTLMWECASLYGNDMPIRRVR